jgi:HSP20 family molecular chaperone IbpA
MSSYKCQRSIRLPVDVKEDDIQASMENGVLNVKLPKVHPKKKERTEIKIN